MVFANDTESALVATVELVNSAEEPQSIRTTRSSQRSS